MLQDEVRCWAAWEWYIAATGDYDALAPYYLAANELSICTLLEISFFHCLLPISIRGTKTCSILNLPWTFSSISSGIFHYIRYSISYLEHRQVYRVLESFVFNMTVSRPVLHSHGFLLLFDIRPWSIYSACKWMSSYYGHSMIRIEKNLSGLESRRQ